MSRLPEGSLVVVTGANGYVASHVVDQLLIAEFNVRGTVREPAKAIWLRDYVENTYGPGRFEAAIVTDLAVEGAFDQVVKGAAAFVHTASILTFSNDADQVIPGVLQGVNLALEACEREPSIRHFIYTSSSGACLYPRSNTAVTVKKDTWNEESIRLAHQAGPEQSMHVYCASKVLAEQAVWKFERERNQHFTINTVVPNMNWGSILAPGMAASDSTGGLVPAIVRGGLKAIGGAQSMPPQHHVDVQDNARLHVAPLLDTNIKNERLFALNEPFNLHDVLEILRKLRPDRVIEGNPDNSHRDLSTIKLRARAEAILRDVFGRPGFTTLEGSIKNNIAHIP